LAAQRAVEEVYWKHRIWPAENPKPKPPLEAVMPLDAIRARVEDSLRLSNALEIYWGTSNHRCAVTGRNSNARREIASSPRFCWSYGRHYTTIHTSSPRFWRGLPLAERLARIWYEDTKGAKNFGRRSFDAWWRSVSADLPVTLNAPAYNLQLV
jgi:hypothetical protein